MVQSTKEALKVDYMMATVSINGQMVISTEDNITKVDAKVLVI